MQQLSHEQWGPCLSSRCGGLWRLFSAWVWGWRKFMCRILQHRMLLDDTMCCACLLCTIFSLLCATCYALDPDAISFHMFCCMKQAPRWVLMLVWLDALNCAVIRRLLGMKLHLAACDKQPSFGVLAAVAATWASGSISFVQYI